MSIFGGEEKGEEVAAQRQDEKWDENSPSLFKEEAQQIRKGERWGQKTLCLPPIQYRWQINVDRNLMGRAWTDGTLRN